MASIGFNLEFWSSLSAQDQAVIEMVADAEMSLMTRDYNGNNGRADGRRLASSSLDHTAKVWDLETKHELITLRAKELHSCNPSYEHFCENSNTACV